MVAASLVAALVGIGVFGGRAIDWLRGYAIYHGLIAVRGRIAGHSFDLPGSALRCAGCHKRESSALARNGELSLDLRELAIVKSRRGGPRSAYTTESFCATLRTGLDPGAIILARAMPRFELQDEDCRALWIFLELR